MNITIAIDGYSGTGKSTTAKKVADILQFTYIDSGAMYRAITYHLIQKKVDIANLQAVKSAISSSNLSFDEYGIALNGIHIESQIRTMEINNRVSEVSAISIVRRKLVEEQRKMSQNKSVVMDGRDIGTVVFPTAELKVFMTADLEVRVSRRKSQLSQKGVEESAEAIRSNLLERDRIDTTRHDSPLKRAQDAIEIDTSHLTMDEQVNKIVNLADKLRLG